MQQFLSAIRKSVEEQNWFAALFLSLAMPDICAQTESPSPKYAKDIGQKYQAWYDKYMAHHYTRIDDSGKKCGFLSKDCWSFRCKCLHAGLTAEERESISKFSFRAPIIAPGINIVIGVMQIDDRMSIQINDFAEKMCQSIERWRHDVSDNPEINERINALIEINDDDYEGIICVG